MRTVPRFQPMASTGGSGTSLNSKLFPMYNVYLMFICGKISDDGHDVDSK